MIVDDAPVFFEHFYGDVADGGRRRYCERRFHVLHDLRCGAAKWNGFVIGRNGGRARRRLKNWRLACPHWSGSRRRRDRRGRLSSTGSDGDFLEVFFELRLVVAKELTPRRTDRVRIRSIFLVQLFDEGDVGAVGLRDGHTFPINDLAVRRVPTAYA